MTASSQDGLLQALARSERRAAPAVERIVLEAETPGDLRTMFRLRLDEKIVGEGLTAAQVHVLVGEVLDRLTVPRPA